VVGVTLERGGAELVLRAGRDPLAIAEQKLDEGALSALRARVDAEIEAAFQQALADPYPEPGEALP
jgi:TPP-dependent pyruvate/acetoin dehydrogenase alpha subunit